MFVGRTDALNRLGGLWQKSTPSLVTVRGRRRIGKSTLVSEFARRTADHFISIDGQAPGEGVNNKVQLQSFMEQLSMQTDAPDVTVKNWLQAFRMLGNALPKDGRVVVLLDEISWMGGYDKSFAGTLKIVWDKMLKKRDNLVLVLCGSVSSWIADNILNGTGFAGRDSLDLVVNELPLSVCRAFWGEAVERTSTSEMLDMLSVMGGVPKYLEEINPSLSSDEGNKPQPLVRREHSPAVLHARRDAVQGFQPDIQPDIRQEVLGSEVASARPCIRIQVGCGDGRGLGDRAQRTSCGLSHGA